MNVLLCGSFIAWLSVMLVRNLKRDYQEIRPLSRWEAVGCAAFLNFLIYALLKPAGAANLTEHGPRQKSQAPAGSSRAPQHGARR